MSLPVSIMGYTTAKILANTLVFLVVWLSLITANIIFVTNTVPTSVGSIPFTMVIFGMIFALFRLNLSVALVTESDKVTRAVTMVSNIAFWFFWGFFRNTAVVSIDLHGPTIVWRSPILWILAAELATIPIFLGLTLYFQSRKTDFI